jgi:hypothetical protein
MGATMGHAGQRRIRCAGMGRRRLSASPSRTAYHRIRRRSRSRPRPLLERGGAFALADSVLAQPPQPFRWRLAPEAVQIGAIAASSYGFAGSTQLLFSDFLGDHSLYLAGDVFSNSIQDANLLAIYSVLPHRLDWSVGVFHLKNYYQSRVTTLGEQLSGAKLFSERSFGALGGVTLPVRPLPQIRGAVHADVRRGAVLRGAAERRHRPRSHGLPHGDLALVVPCRR